MESLSKSKSECLSKLLSSNQVDVVALQETHVENLNTCDHGNIPGYKLVGEIGHRAYGVATYVRDRINDVTITHKSCVNNVFILAVKVSNTSKYLQATYHSMARYSVTIVPTPCYLCWRF